jgi:hypothetical protein
MEVTKKETDLGLNLIRMRETGFQAKFHLYVVFYLL